MTTIEDDVNTIVVTVTSPDGRIEGQAESLRYLSVRFLHDSYERHYRYREPALLARQLGRTATLLSAAYQKARREVMRAHDFEWYSTPRPPFSSWHREYLERGAKLTARGSSREGEIRVTTVGLIDFDVSIASDVLNRHDEQAFLQLATGAMEDLQADYQRSHSALRHELYLKYKDKER